MTKRDVSIAIDPEAPRFGDELRVSVQGAPGVFRITGTRDGTVIYGAGGNATDPTVTLSSLSWTEGPAHLVIEALDQRKSGNPVVVAKREVDVEG